MTLDAIKTATADEKRRLLARLLAEKAAQPQTHTPSFGQERLWFVEQLESEVSKGAYNILIALGLQGTLNREALRASLNEIVRRHSVLRTSYRIDDSGNPVAVIAARVALDLPVVDMGGVPEESIQRHLTAEIDQPFDLAAGPLVRAHLVQRSDRDHILVWAVHHSVFDGFSIAVWTRELAALYTPYCAGLPSPLPELPAQYRDFADWQRRQFENGIFDKQLRFWTAKLAGAPPLLTLPTDRPRPAVQSTNGSTSRSLLPPKLTHALKRFSQDAGVTLFTTLQCAFVILLSRWSGQRDIVIGTAVTSRVLPRFEPLIGFLVNTLVLRTGIEDNPAFLTLLKRVQENTLEALANQDVPFEKLVAALAPERNTSHAPLAQVSISWTQSLMNPGDGFGGLVARPYPVDSTTSQRDLSLLLTEMEGSIAGLWEFNTDLFEPWTIERMASHFEALLEGICQDPTRKVLDLPLLAPDEYRTLIHDWNAAEVDYGAPRPVHELFEEQVLCVPDSVAVTYQGRVLTYRELNARANRLAHYLIDRGMGPDSLVAIAARRSDHTIVALLAILKSGAGYLPIDPSYPAERIRYMLADSGASLLLTMSEAGLPAESQQWAPGVVVSDSLDRELNRHSTENPGHRAGASHLAYVIYTSGSTGRPKGAAIEHGGLFHYIQWCRSQYGVELGSGSLVHSSLAFDLTVTSIWAPLASGATAHIMPESESIEELADTLRSLPDLSFLKLTPGHLQLLNRQLRPEEFRSRARMLIVGGEALHSSVLAPWFEFAPEVRIVNEYGPTETVVGCIVYEAKKEDQREWIKIGRPIANTRAYILDEGGNPNPIGVPGELYLGGAQLGRGYWRHPEVTEQRFIPHPTFGRLYRTGDLCRWLREGDIEYLGRTDHQVKIRGFRIELGEIESALKALPGVREAAVLAREDKPGVKQLVGYVERGVENTLTAEILKRELTRTLPHHMVPSAFVVLDAMPINRNGKIDRASLPAPDYTESLAAFAAPGDETEAALLDVFASVLKVPAIGIHDNFFHLGGDSILILQVVSRAAQHGFKLRVRDVFKHPTVAQLAEAVRAACPNQEIPSTASQDLELGEAPLLPVQRRFLDADHAEMHHSNQPVLLRVKSPLDPDRLEAAVAGLLRHHDALRLEFNRGEAGWRQRYLGTPAKVPLSIVPLVGETAEERALEIETVGTHVQSSLNPLTGDLARFVYFTTPGRHVDGERLLIAVHHLAMDGISRRILMEDLTTLLDGGQLPAKTSSYGEWAVALKSACERGRFNPDLATWREIASRPIAALPVEHPDAPNTMASSHYLSMVLPGDRTARLRAFAISGGLSVDAIILTALSSALSVWTGEAWMRVLLESYGRQEIFDTIHLDRTVGWFTSIYPVLLPASEGSAPSRVRSIQKRLEAIDSGGLSFGALRYYHPDPEVRGELAAIERAPVMYNNFSRLASIENTRFAAAPESPGQRVAGSLRKDTAIDCDVIAVEDHLQINWRVTPQLGLGSAQSLLNRFGRELNLLLDELASEAVIALGARA